MALEWKRERKGRLRDGELEQLLRVMYISHVWTATDFELRDPSPKTVGIYDRLHEAAFDYAYFLTEMGINN